MGLDASVMCGCFAKGLTTDPPFPREWLRVDEEGYMHVVPDHDRLAFSIWIQSCCPHPRFDYAWEHIANWSGFRLFQDAMERAGWERFPTLRAELPEVNGGLALPSASALALQELEEFRGLGALGTNACLVDSTTGEALYEHIGPYEGIFILDGRTGVDVGVGEFTFFIRDRETGVDLFRSARFRQTLLDHDLHPYDDEPGRVEYFDPDTGEKYTGRTAVSGEAIPWPDGRMQDDRHRVRFDHPAGLHVEAREIRPGDFAPILDPLARVFRASVETGNPVRWC